MYITGVAVKPDVIDTTYIDDLLVEFFPAKARELNILQTPVELDMFSMDNLPAGVANNVWSQEIKS